jgi:hypothetical protein
MIRTLGWLLGIDEVQSIDRLTASLAAPWAEGGAFWVFLLAAASLVAGLVYYVRLQSRGSRASRVLLGGCRGLLLALLIVTLADPVLEMTVIHERKPLLYAIFDGTDSMAIADELPAAERARIERAVGWQPKPSESSASQKPTRTDYIQALLRKAGDNPLARLLRDNSIEVEPFLFDGNTTSQLRKLDAAKGSGFAGSRRLDLPQLAAQLSTKGQVTALGSVIEEINQQFGSSRLAGVMLFSDFVNNAGISALGGGAESPASRLGVPVYAIGVGATEAIDLAIDLQTDPKMKKAERSSVVVKLRQSGLEGQTVTLRLAAHKLSEQAAGEREIAIGQRTVTLTGGGESLDFPFTPEDAGRFEFVATADALPGEVVSQNNQVARQVNIIDDYLRLMYVAYEPTWEWRFIKEVFHRDKLVGMEGFRTFLSSSDPKVRESNVLFLPTLTPRRSEFFAQDVIFLDDMPQAALSQRFCEMVKEYVSNLGGGLVVIAGPRFGPRELYQTLLADMLPVIIDPNADLRTAPARPEFRPRITPHAARYPFMQLGSDAAETEKAWDNLGKLPWYQPVAAVHPQAEVLAEHPTDKCGDGKTPEPLIAIRKYGKGEVVYLGFNETWRLRREYGEKYYRQFWSQLIYRLGMSHALGAEKRFVARVDQQQYRAEDKVTLTVEAYDENYEPLGDDKLGNEKLSGRGLAAELIVPGTAGAQPQPLVVPLVRKGLFETHIPVYAAGAYSLKVTDPVTGRAAEQRFEVTPLSAERRSGVRDERLQTELARATGGRAYDLTTVSRLPGDLKLQPITERLSRNYALWTTPLWFGLVVALMLGEWLARKLIRLS